MFKDGFNLHNFVKMALTKKLVQVVDPNLLKREVEDLEVATKEDDNNNDDQDDIEATEELEGIQLKVGIYLKKSKGHKLATCHFNKKIIKILKNK